MTELQRGNQIPSIDENGKATLEFSYNARSDLGDGIHTAYMLRGDALHRSARRHSSAARDSSIPGRADPIAAPGMRESA